jgi:pre-mRNA-processing factor 8
MNSNVFHPDTPVLLYNGTIKMAKDLAMADVLMGDDSSPRNITILETGNSEMYKIVPIKGEPFIVGKDHVLTLILSKNSNTVWRPDRNYYDVRWYVSWL